jgi:hypothetical protein
VVGCNKRRHDSALKVFLQRFVSQGACFPSPFEILAIEFEHKVLEEDMLIDRKSVTV